MPVEFVKPKINPALIQKEDVKLLKEAKKHLYASKLEAATTPGKHIYICYAVQAAAGVKQTDWIPPHATDEYLKKHYPAVRRVNRMIQVALFERQGCLDAEKTAEDSTAVFSNIQEYWESQERELCEARHAWLDYMIETCEEYFK